MPVHRAAIAAGETWDEVESRPARSESAQEGWSRGAVRNQGRSRTATRSRRCPDDVAKRTGHPPGLQHACELLHHQAGGSQTVPVGGGSHRKLLVARCEAAATPVMVTMGVQFQ